MVGSRLDSPAAVAMLGDTTTPGNLARDLQGQLQHSVAGFAEAIAEFHRRVPRAEREKLDFLGKLSLRPLAGLSPAGPVARVVLDGFDQLSDGRRRQLRDALAVAPDHLRLIMTARDNTPDCPDGQVIRARRTDRAVLGRYLEDRGIPEEARAAILDRAQDLWLITELLADAVLEQPGLDLARLPETVNEAYALRLNQAGAADAWPTRFRPVLGPLAVAGTGPVLPLALLVHASAVLEGPSDDSGSVPPRDPQRSPSAAWSRDAILARRTSMPDCFIPPWPSTSSAPKPPRPPSQSTPRPPIAASPARLMPWLLGPTTKRDNALHRYAFLRRGGALAGSGRV